MTSGLSIFNKLNASTGFESTGVPDNKITRLAAWKIGTKFLLL